MKQDRVENVYHWFYRTERMGVGRLSDGGGPFGFDVTTALLVDDVIARAQCDAIIETGCFMGDTTAYLSRAYPNLPVVTCDIDAASVAFVRHRLADQANVRVELQSSPTVIRAFAGQFHQPFFYLDAHWGEPWPLPEELAAIESGVVCIDDFDVGHRRFSHDTYGGVPCGPEVLWPFAAKFSDYYLSNPLADLPLPCLQVGRRAGRCFLSTEPNPDCFDERLFYTHAIAPVETFR